MSKSVKQVAAIALPIGLSLVAPGIGTALGSTLGAATLAGIGGAVGGGIGGAITGGGVTGALKGAAIGGVGGYLSGGGATELFGGTKLIRISPNKTWSGVFGSIILSQFAILIFYLDESYLFNINIIFSQLFLSIVGQIGDILMSYIKRKNNKKDSSNFIPGHGGFLDRVDGLIWIIIFGNIFI